MNESIRLLEEKIAFLEHHVTQQDKVMLEMSEDIARLRRDLNVLAARLAQANAGPAGGGDLPDERPPHY